MTPPKPTIAPSTDALSAQEFRRGVKRDKSHYTNLKDDKHFNSWNRGFVATAYMHHTQHVLDEHYIPDPTNPTELALFTKMQVFMYAVLEEHLKTDTGKSLVSQYEETRDAQSIYRELKRHAKSSTAAQLSGDTLLKYITSARYPGTWRGTSYAFVLHWKEQVAHYEKLELEAIPPKQKLRMLQNTVGDVSDLANVKQLSDQVVARRGQALVFEGYCFCLLVPHMIRTMQLAVKMGNATFTQFTLKLLMTHTVMLPTFKRSMWILMYLKSLRMPQTLKIEVIPHLLFLARIGLS